MGRNPLISDAGERNIAPPHPSVVILKFTYSESLSPITISTLYPMISSPAEKTV